jgi:hypothetical protein
VTNSTAEFIPFNALNEFMRPDYRQAVVRATLAALPGLPGNVRAPVDRLVRQHVRVPGFRNAAQAPVSLRVNPTISTFEKSPELVAALLAAWAEANADLRARVYDLLTARGWEVLPSNADRTRLPGFLTRWPAHENFETLNEAYAAAYPEARSSTDDVSLMVVWLSGRLPVKVDEAEIESGTGGEGLEGSPTAGKV